MFLRISIFALFLTAFQLQAGDISFNVDYCTKDDFIKKTKLEIILCAIDCPLEVIDIIHGYVKKNTLIMPSSPFADFPCYIFDATKPKRSTILA
jgi:hypothetical protein